MYVEFVVDTGKGLFHSPGNTIRLAGRGDIVFTETLYDDGSGRPATAAITGGTGEFFGAKGFVVSTSLPTGGDFVITISDQAPPTSQAPSTLHLTEHPTNVGDVPIRSLTGCTSASHCRGDYMIGHDPMFDAATGTQVGS